MKPTRWRELWKPAMCAGFAYIDYLRWFYITLGAAFVGLFVAGRCLDARLRYWQNQILITEAELDHWNERLDNEQ